jgi:hypothetical protein
MGCVAQRAPAKTLNQPVQFRKTLDRQIRVFRVEDSAPVTGTRSAWFCPRVVSGATAPCPRTALQVYLASELGPSTPRVGVSSVAPRQNLVSWVQCRSSLGMRGLDSPGRPGIRLY